MLAHVFVCPAMASLPLCMCVRVCVCVCVCVCAFDICTNFYVIAFWSERMCDYAFCVLSEYDNWVNT